MNSKKILSTLLSITAILLLSVLATTQAQAQTCTPTTTVTEGDLAPGGIPSFGVSSGPGSVTVDHVNAGTGLQSLTVVGKQANVVVNIPPFTPGTFDPVTATFTVIDPSQPVDFTLRAASTFHAIFIRVRCGTVSPTQALMPAGNHFQRTVSIIRLSDHSLYLLGSPLAFQPLNSV